VSEDILKSMDNKLKTIIKLLSLEVVKGRTFTEQVELLDTIGLTPTEIAACLGKTPNNVRVTLHKLRKGSSKEEE